MTETKEWCRMVGSRTAIFQRDVRRAMLGMTLGLATLTAAAGCSDPAGATTGLGGSGDTITVVDASGDGSGGSHDVGAGSDAATGADSGAQVNDTAALNDAGATADATTGSGGTDTATGMDSATGIDAGGVQDTGAIGPDITQVGPQGVGTLYAHTSSTLWKLNLGTLTFGKVGKFSFNKSFGSVTDIALDKNGVLYAITFNDVFVCSEITAKCTWLAKLPQSFNGLTFVPLGTVDKNDEALIGIANSGTWNHIKVNAGKATIKKLGSYGGGWQSSGDAFSVEGIGTFATVNKGGFSTGGDSLVKVDPKTGKILKVIGSTNAKSLWGFAWWGGVFYGFSSSGVVYAINEKTGKAKPVSGMKVPKGQSWWGAGVSTRAAGILQG